MKTTLKRNLLLTLVLVSLSAVLVGVAGCTGSDNNGTTEWILKAHKPIVCRKLINAMDGATYWTLIDADGKTYASGSTTLNLPDTIRVATSN